MKQNNTIEIGVTANGFLVRQYEERGTSLPLESSHCFQSFAELNEFLTDHLDYRSGVLKGDKKK